MLRICDIFTICDELGEINPIPPLQHVGQLPVIFVTNWGEMVCGGGGATGGLDNGHGSFY